MYPAIPGRNMVVMLPTCVLAEMYPAIPGRDVAVTLPTCVLAEMYQANLGWDVADLLPFWVSKSTFLCCCVSSLSYLFYQYGGII